MGGGQSLPEKIDEETVRRLAGGLYDSNDFEEMSKNTPGYITRDQPAPAPMAERPFPRSAALVSDIDTPALLRRLVMAAQKRGLSLNLRNKKANKSFTFGEFAAKKDDERSGETKGERKC